MRKFSAWLNIPLSCDCCGAALPLGDMQLSRGSYRLEFPEGEFPTELCIGNAVRIKLGAGKLVVELRQSSVSKGTWALLPHYNTDAFGRVKQDSFDEPRAEAQSWYWHRFAFELRQFRPTFSTWAAQLRFVEADPLTLHAVHGKVPAHNGATFTLSLDSL